MYVNAEGGAWSFGGGARWPAFSRPPPDGCGSAARWCRSAVSYDTSVLSPDTPWAFLGPSLLYSGRGRIGCGAVLASSPRLDGLGPYGNEGCRVPSEMEAAPRPCLLWR